MKVMIEKSPVLAVAVGLLLMGLSLQRAQAQTDCPIETKILPEDGVPDDDNFAWSVALGGASAFVAAPDEESGAGSGSVHVYARDGLEWIFQEKLVPEDAVSDQFFGSALAVEEDRMVIGAMLDSEQEIAGGAAYVFHFDGSGWTQEQKLLPSTGQFLMLFGAAVDVFEDRIVVGTAGSINGDESGWVVVFRHDGEKWVEEQQIIPASGSSGDQFGVGVTIHNDVLAVMASLDDEFGPDAGAVYVYRLDGSTWTQEAKLFPTGEGAGPLSGTSLVLIDDTLYVGAPSDNADGAEAGAVYVFRYEDSVWIQVDRLSASDGEAGDSFGVSVAVAGSVAVFGNFVDDDLAPNAGSAYVFHYDGDAWVESQKLLASDGGPDDNFGASVAVSGDTALIGASFDEILGKGHSAAYVYDGLGVIDCNENGIADNCDIIRGTSQDCTGNWIPDECEPDCNTNGVADSCDIAQGTSEDCTGDGIPDECEPDCNENGMADSCDIAQGADDCNENAIPDECDIAQGTSQDCNGNVIP
ncbi:MAG: hypothetical protein IID37_03050, partial [Planctomycetes bacterium]|nr:hypothetical protein [Planctomycetota bacterium]